MRKNILIGFGLLFAAIGMGQSAFVLGDRVGFAAFAEPPDFLTGCRDVPEAIALMEEYSAREKQIKRYLQAMEKQEADIRQAQDRLTATLTRLKAQDSGRRNQSNEKTLQLAEDIDRMVNVFDAMKPAEAAKVLTNLPADFAAEIVMRLRPENGAKVIAAIEPRQAAVLTTHMGARHLNKN